MDCLSNLIQEYKDDDEIILEYINYKNNVIIPFIDENSIDAINEIIKNDQQNINHYTEIFKIKLLEIIQNLDINDLGLFYLISEIMQNCVIYELFPINNDILLKILYVNIEIINEIILATYNNKHNLMLSELLNLDFEYYNYGIQYLIPYLYNILVFSIKYSQIIPVEINLNKQYNIISNDNIIFKINNINEHEKLNSLENNLNDLNMNIDIELIIKCLLNHVLYFDASYPAKFILLILSNLLGNNFYIEDVKNAISDIILYNNMNILSKSIEYFNNLQFTYNTKIYEIDRFLSIMDNESNEFFVKEFFNFGNTNEYILTSNIVPIIQSYIENYDFIKILEKFTNKNIYNLYLSFYNNTTINENEKIIEHYKNIYNFIISNLNDYFPELFVENQEIQNTNMIPIYVGGNKHIKNLNNKDSKNINKK